MTAPDDLPSDALATWSSLATLLEWLPAALDAQLQRDAGLTHFEYGILYALSRAEGGRLRMSTLAGYAHSSLSRLSRAATRLEARGYLRRETDPDDGRYTVARLTDEGAKARRAAGPGHVDLVKRVVLDPLTPVQQKHLGAITARILAGLGDDPGWGPPGG